MRRRKKIIEVTRTICIKKDSATVFNYFSDLRNDKEWRSEINETKVLNPDPSIHTIAHEDSYLSKKVPNYVAKLICLAYVPNRRIVYQTMPENRYFLRSIREVDNLSDLETRITYSLKFDKAIVKHGIGINLPRFLVNYVTNSSMKKYLKKLKTVLEAEK